MWEIYDNLTGWKSRNVRNSNDPEEYVAEYLSQPKVREKYNLKIRYPYDYFAGQVELALKEDGMNSDLPTFDFILNNSKVKVLLANGMDDAIIPFSSTIKLVQKLKGRDAEILKQKNIQAFKMKNGNIVGYQKQSGKLMITIMLFGGHLLVMDNPKACFEMVESFILNNESNLGFLN